jgi:predicted nucleic acid-binding protein
MSSLPANFSTERVLPFDLDAAQVYAALMADAKAAGRAIGKADGYIAATTFARGFSMATRDVAPFKAAGVNVINPWQAKPA